MTTEPQPRRRLLIAAETMPQLKRHIRIHEDKGRGRTVLLAPERVYEPNDAALAILKQCDGVRTVRDIAAILATQFDADHATIEADIIEVLQGLADQGLLAS